jgi:hypothetical protein
VKAGSIPSEQKAIALVDLQQFFDTCRGVDSVSKYSYYGFEMEVVPSTASPLSHS